MKRTKRCAAAVALAVALAAGPALAADPICPMGGTLIRAEVDRDRAVAWGKEQRHADVNAIDENWTVIAVSRSSSDIALLVAPGGVFFGVAGRGGEVYPRDMERAFGSDLKKLREAVRKGVGDLREAGVLKIAGSDVQPLGDAAGIGALVKEKGGWTLKTEACQPVDLPASGL